MEQVYHESFCAIIMACAPTVWVQGDDVPEEPPVELLDPTFFNWETPTVDPMAITPNGDLLLVVNLPDHHLEVFDIRFGTPIRLGSVPVGLDPVTASTLTVKFSYSILFSICLIIVLVLAQLSLKSPWGRMMRAIRDNETAARAMGKNVTARHLQVFVLGSAVCGLAGAMMTTLDGQLTPGTYQPLRFTFLVWVMVIVGGSGNNYGAVLGGFLIWFLWVQVEPMGLWFLELVTAPLADDSTLKTTLLDRAANMRPLTMGLVLLLVMRFSPRGLLPER